VEIPAGPFVYQEGETRELPTFWIARYPVTNAQYQTFIDDGGYDEPGWWRDLKRPEPESPRWPQPNRPRTDVDWYEAVAFTRWLNARLGLPEGSIRLPTELEWEKAARGTQGRTYPWGDTYQSGFANIFETDNIQTGPWYLDQPTAVGVYPHGASVYGVEDLCGTVWEWCFNSYSTDDDEPGENKHFPRVQRGGSWLNYVAATGGDSRQRIEPGVRNDIGGLRLVVTRDIARGLADSQPA
jgi:formylglycine-generating enzyme required for sulfatase activity